MNKILISVILLVLITLVGCSDKNNSEWSEVEHCLVWGDGIDRETLMLTCVDFVNEDLKCNWQVQKDLSLAVWTAENYSDLVLLPCTKKVIALQIKANNTPTEIIPNIDLP